MGSPALRSDDTAEYDRLARASVLVVGDATLERQVHGRYGVVGADGPGRTLLLGMEEADGGGGAAVVRALSTLGVATAFICVVGDDLAGAQLTALIGRQRHVEPWLLVDGSKSTVTETVYRSEDGPVFRTVREDLCPTADKLRTRMERIALETIALTGVAVLSDRGHGTLDLDLATAIITGARVAGRRVVVDLGGTENVVGRYKGADAVLRLAPPLSGANGTDGGEAAAHALRDDAEARAALLCRDDGTMILADADGVETVRTATAEDGDWNYADRVAVFAAALATGRTMRGAAELAGRLATPQAARAT